jgi:hypothetical protein
MSDIELKSTPLSLGKSFVAALAIPLTVTGCVVTLIIGLPGTSAFVGSSWPLIGVGVGGVILTVVMLFGARIWGPQYFAALASNASFAPAIAAIATLIGYLALDPALSIPYRGLSAVIWGLEVAVTVCIVAAAVDHSRSRNDSSRRALAELDARLKVLRAAVDERASARADTTSGSIDTARQEARVGLAEAEAEVAAAKVDPWAGTRTVVGLWRNVHRVEEAMIEVVPPSELVAGALFDDLRLDASSIGGREHLGKMLRRAIGQIDPVIAERYFGDSSRRGPGQGAKDRQADDAARPLLREVRHAINEFRDGLFEDLVRARDQLKRTTLVASIIAYALLALAVAVQVPAPPLVAAASFFLVGAMVGLFAWLAESRSAHSVVDDFGLFETRAFTNTLLAGLTAVAGVLLLATFESAAISLLPTAPPSPGATTGSVVDIGYVFDLSTNPLGLVVAAVFGLVPGRLTTTLTRNSDDLKRQIGSSQVGGLSHDLSRR